MTTPHQRRVPPEEKALSPIIGIDHLTRCYGKREIVRDLSLLVPGGSIYGFLGHDGMDKTTSICILLGMEDPTRGMTRFSEKITARSRSRPSIGSASCLKATTATAG